MTPNPGCVGASIAMTVATSGSDEPSTMVCAPAGGTLKWIVSLPAKAFASWMAAQRADGSRLPRARKSAQRRLNALDSQLVTGLSGRRAGEFPNIRVPLSWKRPERLSEDRADVAAWLDELLQ